MKSHGPSRKDLGGSLGLRVGLAYSVGKKATVGATICLPYQPPSTSRHPYSFGFRVPFYFRPWLCVYEYETAQMKKRLFFSWSECGYRKDYFFSWSKCGCRKDSFLLREKICGLENCQLSEPEINQFEESKSVCGNQSAESW